MKIKSDYRKNYTRFDEIHIGDCYRLKSFMHIFVKMNITFTRDKVYFNSVNLSTNEIVFHNSDLEVRPLDATLVENYKDNQ